MSQQQDLDQHPYEYLLYYLGFDQEDPTIHELDCSDFCTLSYDQSDHLQIDKWTAGYDEPTTQTLVGFALEDVLTWYVFFYVIPATIAQFQPLRISAADLVEVRTDSSMEGFVVMDITNNQQRIWDGSSWLPFGPQLYLAIDGSQPMAANLDMDGNSIVGATTLYQSTPSALTAWSSDAVGISFTAATPQVLAITGFTVVANPGSDFTANTSTGQIMYTGATTRWFRVTIDYGYTSLAPGSTQQLRFFVSKGGSTTVAKRKEVSFVPSGQVSVFSDSISDIIQLANDDTIQLGGEYSASATVTVSNVSYSIVQV